MNRPKFRVWDIEERKWYKPTYKAYMKQLHDIHIDLDGSLLIRTIDDSGKNVTIHESMFEGRYELLQSTGLFDKNGTEIYEGDILKGVGVIGIAKFDRYLDYEYNNYGLDGWLFSKKLKYGFVDTPLTEYVLDPDCLMEVVGNKFEHPHLLGED